MASPNSKHLLSPSEIAERLQVSLRTVRRLIKSEKIKVMRVGRLIRITPAALNAFMTQAASH
jgi:excisionase family DNA binding protein